MKLSKGGGQFIDDTSTQQWRLMMKIKWVKEKLSSEKALDLPSNLKTKTTDLTHHPKLQKCSARIPSQRASVSSPSNRKKIE